MITFRNPSTWIFLPALVLVVATSGFAQGAGSLRGRVVDPTGGVIVGSTVTLVDANGAESSTTSNREGLYVFAGLSPGVYTLRATAPGFAAYQNLAQVGSSATPVELDVRLRVATEKQELTVTSERPTLALDQGAKRRGSGAFR